MEKTLEALTSLTDYDLRMCHDFVQRSVVKVQGHCLKKCIVPVSAISCKGK